LATGAVISVEADIDYQSTSHIDFEERAGTKVPDHHVSNANLSYTSPDTKWSVSAYVKNIENYAVPTSYVGPSPPSTTSYVVLDAPRTYGLVFSAKF